jgi:hypothetical protein
MFRSLRAWIVVVPLSCFGALAGHELTYRLSGTPTEGTHDYLAHAPQLTLLLTIFGVVGAALVERGSRVVLWPFPAVVLAGFVAQEHIERIAHGGSVPFLFDKPFFLVGLAVQTIVALAAWLIARLLVRVVGKRVSEAVPRVAGVRQIRPPVPGLVVAQVSAGAQRPRAPPFAR